MMRLIIHIMVCPSVLFVIVQPLPNVMSGRTHFNIYQTLFFLISVVFFLPRNEDTRIVSLLTSIFFFFAFFCKCTWGSLEMRILTLIVKY